MRAALLARAESDPEVTGAAFTGSYATGDGDRWSDTDLVLGVRGDPAAVSEAWTSWLYEGFGAVHHWDLPTGSATVVRVVLLPGWLEVDLTFAPEADFGPRGPQWRTVLGTARPQPPFAPPHRPTLVGLCWHHALHARISIERDRLWAADYWIGTLRARLVELACLRLGLPAAHGKGAHLLPEEVTGPLAGTLVRELSAPELRRALAAAAGCFAAELGRGEPELAGRLHGLLAELVR
ncbi:hypothetical protein Sm713_00530 [Streptomyces sp. TS71-3]|nr:hypothetical protein Sm713_00530 [Streptomyces sp. TS71-3]